ncbi:hypothetical protein U1Q18_037027 [Sarracenia purpurea var. burkii]
MLLGAFQMARRKDLLRRFLSESRARRLALTVAPWLSPIDRETIETAVTLLHAPAPLHCTAPPLRLRRRTPAPCTTSPLQAPTLTASGLRLGKHPAASASAFPDPIFT